MAGPVGRGRASCHHTEPDWARYVRAPGEGWPIFAGCRLLVKEGELADDPRTIACTFWGRQPDCPLYEGLAKPAAQAVAGPVPVPPSAEVPLTERQMAAARLASDDYACRGPLTDAVRQRRRASGAAALALFLALAALALWLAR